MTCSSSSVESSSSSESLSSGGGAMSSQLSTFFMSWFTRNTTPVDTSLSTITSRLTRKRSSAFAASPSIFCSTSLASPEQSRM